MTSDRIHEFITVRMMKIRDANHDQRSLSMDEVISDDGDSVRKYVWQTEDEFRVESVLIDHADHFSICISSQVGCKMACRFCATGLGGFSRNLNAAEIADQVRQIAVDLGNDASFEVAFMGMGEPLDNLPEVIGAVSEIGASFPLADFCVSTIGIPDRIDELAAALPDVRLQISVHASDVDTRLKLMPIERRHPLAEVMERAESWSSATGMKATLNYLLLDTVNDSLEDASQLADWFHSLPADRFVLKISDYNPTAAEYSPVSPDGRDAFIAVLEDRGVPLRQFASSGGSVAAGCGQLAHRSADRKRRSL